MKVPAKANTCAPMTCPARGPAPYPTISAGRRAMRRTRSRRGQGARTARTASPSTTISTTGSYFAFWPSPIDEHGIVYDSTPATTAVDLLGYPVALLDVTADKADADVFVYLEEVDPAGQAEVISFGRLKLSRRATGEAPWDNLGLPFHPGLQQDAAPLAENATARLAISMMPLSHRIEPGMRLRFVITGADPRQRNLAEVRQDPPPVLNHPAGLAGRIADRSAARSFRRAG